MSLMSPNIQGSYIRAFLTYGDDLMMIELDLV